jgi:translation initiation factor IF-3
MLPALPARDRSGPLPTWASRRADARVNAPSRRGGGGNRPTFFGERIFTYAAFCTILCRPPGPRPGYSVPCNDQKDATAIARRPHNAPPTRDTGPRVNERIRASEIRLIGADGENIGVITPDRAMLLAEEAGLDLVEISPNATPPVAKIMDFGKYKYETQKKESEARKKQKIIEIKEIKFRPNTDTHDYDVKMRSVMKFLEGGDKVKVTLRFRGREMAHAELGRKLLERVADDVTALGKIEAIPRLEGRQMVMMINPVKH